MRSPSATSAPGPRWYRSLYWRVALGFIAFLAVLLLAQSALFIWLSGRAGGAFPASSNTRLAVLVANDLRNQLEQNAATDLRSYTAQEYGRVVQPFIVVLMDGGAFTNHGPLPPALLRQSRVRLARLAERPAFARGRAPAPPPPGEERPDLAPISHNNALVGIVVVPAGPPPVLGAVRVLGPTLALSAIVLLVVGSAAAAFLIFGPVSRRLREVEAAAGRIGAGDVGARAPEHGGDEVAALARSFNRMAADLQARADALGASDRVRRQLLADVSHELMTPLTAMRGYVETLTMAEMQLEPATRERYLRIVDEETRRLETIVGDLLDLAKLEGRGVSLRHDTVSIPALFARVTKRHERECRDRGIHLLTHAEPGATDVRGDADRLEQALQNLTANALRHTADGGDVRLEATTAGDSVHITVRDNGEGIPAEHLPHIFDRFYKVDNARKASGRSGLGLSIVKAIIEAHGGTVTARNEDGAVFDVALPRK